MYIFPCTHVLTSLGAVFQYLEDLSLPPSPSPSPDDPLPIILRVRGHLFLSFSCKLEMEGRRDRESILLSCLLSLVVALRRREAELRDSETSSVDFV